MIGIFSNSLAIYLAAYLVPSVDISGWRNFLICGIILSLINVIVKPILKLISLPFIILTLGFFNIVINIAVIWLLTKFVGQLHIVGLLAFILTALIVSVVNYIINFLTKKPE